MFANLFRHIYIRLVAIGRNTNLRKFRFIDNLNAYLRKKLKSDYIISKRHNFKIYLDDLDSLRLSIYKDWEPFETSLMEKLVKEGDVVLDIGANIGFDTLMLSKLVGKTGKVYAFEPDPKNFSIAKKNISENKINNVVLLNMAVSDKNGQMELYISELNTAANSMFNEVGSKSTKVNAVSLDKYFGPDFRADFIKMDIEGSEGMALKGMTKIINNSKEIILITEYAPLYLNGVGKDINSAKKYLESLKDAGFKFFDILERKKKLIPMEIGDIAKIHKEGCKEGFANLLCIKDKVSLKKLNQMLKV